VRFGSHYKPRRRPHQGRWVPRHGRPGRDPIAAKKAAKAAAKGRRTFAQCATELFGLKQSEWRSATHKRQWTDSLASCKILGPLNIDEIDPAAVLRELQHAWIRTPASASRLRGRIENVLDYGIALGLRQGPNPAAMKGNLAHFLPKRPRLAQKHMPTMPYEEVPGFIARLRATASPSMSLKAVEFIALTACRTGEAVNASRSEFDLDAKIWTIPAGHTKAGREHRIPLSDPAVAIIEWCDARRTDGGDLVFQGRFPGVPLAELTRHMPAGSSVHGLRSSFRDYCGNETAFPREHVEQCLAHQAGDATERAYRRSDALERRREIMNRWAAYLGSAQLVLQRPVALLPVCESPELAG
jgi:integrase